MAHQYPSKQIPLRSIKVDLADVKKIYGRLCKAAAEQGEREIADLVRNDETSVEDWDKYIENVRSNAFRVCVQITGNDGQSCIDFDESAFDPTNLPNRIASVNMNNVTAYRILSNVDPINRFSLDFDFSQPSLLDTDNFASEPTSNTSQLTVSGNNDSWVATVSNAVVGVLGDKATMRSFLHYAHLYDFGVVGLGFPLGFFVAWKASTYIDSLFDENSPFLSAAAYVYLMIVALWFYRFLFGYAKWAFPTVELAENDKVIKAHRKFWYLLIITILGAIIYDVFWG